MGDTDLQLGLGLGEHYYAPPPRKDGDPFEKKPPLISFDIRFSSEIFSRDNLDDKASIGNNESKNCEAAMKIDDRKNGCRKKLKLTQNQTSTLESYFKSNTTLTQANKLELAGKLNLKQRQVEVWFQNRRARTKVKQTVEDREMLKRCCESLKSENKKLKKELQELRSHFPSYLSCEKSPSH